MNSDEDLIWINGKPMKWSEMSDADKMEAWRNMESYMRTIRGERDYLRILLLSQSGRTGEEIDRLKYGW